MVLLGPLPDGVDLGLVVVGEVRTGEAAGGGDDGVGGGLDMRDSEGDVRLPWKNKDAGMREVINLLIICWVTLCKTTPGLDRVHRCIKE